MQHLDPVTDAARHMTAKQIEADRFCEASEIHSDCIIDAIKAGGARAVPAPWNGTQRPYLPAWEIVQDLPCDPAVGDRIAQDLVQLLGARIKAGDSFAIAIGQRIGAIYGSFCAGETA